MWSGYAKGEGGVTNSLLSLFHALALSKFTAFVLVCAVADQALCVTEFQEQTTSGFEVFAVIP